MKIIKQPFIATLLIAFSVYSAAAYAECVAKLSDRNTSSLIKKSNEIVVDQKQKKCG